MKKSQRKLSSACPSDEQTVPKRGWDESRSMNAGEASVLSPYDHRTMW